MDTEFDSEISDHAHNYSSGIVLDTLDAMNRDIHTMQESFLKLGVKSHMLEVDLATLFSPELLLELEQLEESCQECTQAVNNLVASHNTKKCQDTDNTGVKEDADNTSLMERVLKEKESLEVTIADSTEDDDAGRKENNNAKGV